MSRTHSPALALALALALAASAAEAQAPPQQITTSKGMRTLPGTAKFTTELQYRQAARTAEDLVDQLLLDIDVIEKSRGGVLTDAGGLSEKIKRDTAAFQTAKSAFDQREQKYRVELTAFQQKQAALEGEIQQQRNQAAALQALPSAQRDYAQVSRLNDWANRITQQRQALEGDRGHLLTEQADIEQQRASLTRLRAETESKLKGARDSTVAQYGSNEQKRLEAYRQLRLAMTYLRQARDEVTRRSARSMGRSEVAERANARLAAFDASRRGAGATR